MLDLALIRSEPARVKAALARRGVPAEAIDAVVDLDRRWSARQEVQETLRARRRQISDEVARRRSAHPTAHPGGPPAASAPVDRDLVRAGREVGQDLRAVGDAMADLRARRDAALSALPNLPATDVPDAPPALDPAGPVWPKPFAPLAHWDLLAMLRLSAPAGGSAGSGFLLWRGEGARLVHGLVRLMLDVHAADGREEVLAPPVATRRALEGSAHLPLLEEKMYRVVEPAAPGEPGAPPFEPAAEAAGHVVPAGHVPRASDVTGCFRTRLEQRRALRSKGAEGREAGPDGALPAHDLFLAPRAEPHLAALHAGEVLDAAALPHRLAASATAFRRESHGGGSAGRGLLRLHAFPTVEVYTFCRAAESDAELERAVASAETILGRLEVAHRRRLRAATDLSHAAARTVSLDVWCPGLPTAEGHPEARGRWLEVAALSSFTDYQARRTGTQVRDAGGRTRLVYTVGGAAVALPRLIAALMETGQEADGSVRLPPALVPYVGTDVLGAAHI